MMQTTLLVWARTKSDSRNTASSVHSYIVLKGSAVAAAREIDTFGQSAADRLIVTGKLAAALTNGMYGGTRAASGHGVTIKYANGRSRKIRAYDDQ